MLYYKLTINFIRLEESCSIPVQNKRQNLFYICEKRCSFFLSCITGVGLNNDECLENLPSKYRHNLAFVVVWSPHNSGSNFTVSDVRGS